MMEDISTLYKPGIITDKKARTNFNSTNLSPERTVVTFAIYNMIDECGENIFFYLNWLGLANEPNLMVLSSGQQNYYDYNDFKGVTTLINLKKLNLIKNLDTFLYTVCHVLSPGTNFIGCFSDRNSSKGRGSHLRMYKRFMNFMDSGPDLDIDKKDVSRLLETHGFKVIDMTEINGVTYFRTRSNGRTVDNG